VISLIITAAALLAATARCELLTDEGRTMLAIATVVSVLIAGALTLGGKAT
jgi:hypothetical protein